MLRYPYRSTASTLFKRVSSTSPSIPKSHPSIILLRHVTATSKGYRVTIFSTATTRTTTTTIPQLPYWKKPIHLRCLSSNTTHNEKTSTENTKGKEGADGDEEMRQELVLTPGQKVVAYSRLGMWTGILVFAGFCAYYIGKELFPSKMSPNSAFDKAFAIIRDHPEVNRKFGPPLKAYGRDHGGHREGRRNFIEHTEYVSKDDGTKRTRIRFNLEGNFGTAFVFAEVSSDMPSGEFVYLLVQDKRNGRVTTVIDNRSVLAAKRMMEGNEEGQKAFATLLGGNKKD